MFTDVKEKQMVGPRRNAQLDNVLSRRGRGDSALTAGREHSPRAPEAPGPPTNILCSREAANTARFSLY